MLDDLAHTNRQRWNNLAQAGVAYTRPFLDLDAERARQELDPFGVMGDVRARDVLVLAGGGGQQSAAFAVLGARVTVLDLSDGQLENDRRAAAHYGYALRAEQGDMRDLSHFPPHSFDIVFQPYSINFVPDPRVVFAQVARVLRPSGLYRVDFANPFTMNQEEKDWNGSGYPLRGTYQDGELEFSDPDWEFLDGEGQVHRVTGPREFRHTLSRFVNGLITQGFSLLGIWEELSGDPGAPPGSWEHYISVAPPYLKIWARKTG